LIVNIFGYGAPAEYYRSLLALWDCRGCWCVSKAGVKLNGDTPLYAIGKGEVLFLPAIMAPCTLWPRGAVDLLEIALPE
jgi:hypothetical protein